MIAIQTYFIGPTNYRGSRIKAVARKNCSVTLNWEHGLSVGQNHKAAAAALAHKMRWAGEWMEAGLGDDGASVWVNVSVGSDSVIVEIDPETYDPADDAH